MLPGRGILLSVPLLVVHATLMRVLDATLMRDLEVTLMRVLDVTLMRVLGFTWFFLLITLLISLFQDETPLCLEIMVFYASKSKTNKDYCNNQIVKHFVHCPKRQ